MIVKPVLASISYGFTQCAVTEKYANSIDIVVWNEMIAPTRLIDFPVTDYFYELP